MLFLRELKKSLILRLKEYTIYSEDQDLGS